MLFVYTCSHTAGTFKNTNILPALASAALTLMNALKKKKKGYIWPEENKIPCVGERD